MLTRSAMREGQAPVAVATLPAAVDMMYTMLEDHGTQDKCEKLKETGAATATLKEDVNVKDQCGATTAATEYDSEYDSDDERDEETLINWKYLVSVCDDCWHPDASGHCMCTVDPDAAEKYKNAVDDTLTLEQAQRRVNANHRENAKRSVNKALDDLYSKRERKRSRVALRA